MKTVGAKTIKETPNPTNAKQLAQALFAQADKKLPVEKRRLTKRLQRRKRR